MKFNIGGEDFVYSPFFKSYTCRMSNFKSKVKKVWFQIHLPEI